MRILFVNQYYPPDASATAYLLGELAEDLAHHHDVQVIAGRPSYNPNVSTFAPAGVRLTRTWSTTFSRAGLAGRFLNYGTFLLSASLGAVLAPRPDVVVALTDPPVIGLIGLMAARRHRVPFVYVCEDIFPDVGVALGRVDNPIAVRAWRRLNRVLRRGASQIVAIGRDMAEKLEAEGVPATKISMIPNWGNEPPPKPDINRVREAMGWQGKQVVMHAGNMGLAQNLGIMIEVAEIVRDEAPEIQLVLVGDGAAREHLMNEATRRMLTNMTFLEYRPKDEAQGLIAAANMHLISLAPGLKGSVVPSKLYGLLGAGMPFIAAVDEGSEVHLVIEDERCGIRVDPGDAYGLAKAIVTTTDEDLCKMGRRARHAFEARYARSIAIGAYRRMLEQVSRRRSLSA
jgi:colanic acid biosynthesis glycosyl transferase WcaI